MENRLAYQFQRTETDSVCVSLREFKQRTYIDLRIFYRSNNSSELLPTKKGITLAIQFIPELKKSLDAVERLVREEEAQTNGRSTLQKVAKSV